MSAITVKPMSWQRIGTSLWAFRHGDCAMAYIQRHLDNRYCLDWYPQTPRHHSPSDFHATFDAAKAAAQAQWEAFVRSAIEEATL